MKNYAILGRKAPKILRRCAFFFFVFSEDDQRNLDAMQAQRQASKQMEPAHIEASVVPKAIFPRDISGSSSMGVRPNESFTSWKILL